ncbi:flagellar hook-associated protein FlgK [Solidesulfovibrio sp.]|uniref:flagellar hook-associated protein FlgK n=1 Tax=Solidesulfovibrio sp. TaxID=2910990 RepID=UPI000EE1D1CA|nr:flagellar hook-associated protein FlgK [Solidesulfovibrio sp.]MEA5087981.1 flagellar hook-associated protein FlgK [Solidesulfovibrio sp.]HCR12868.1 flagellar hook-associated protein FlgK [Desulfovibrio sp.]HML60357.1 flagellar hook-associated protein FlgK [Solidesulfovibrio sp.]
MSSLSSVLSIGRSALTASQAALQVTGNNVANVDTEGYSKQSVVLRDGAYITTQPGQLGSGVVAQEVVRAYDALTESQYVSQISTRDRWKAMHNGLTSIQSLFNESNTKGANAALSKFFADWGDLTTNPSAAATRQTMLEDSQTLFSIYRSMSDSLSQQKTQLNTAIGEDVDKLNQLAKDVADLNRKINQYQIDGVSNPNSLYDQRDAKVEAMASLVDVNVVDNGKGNYTVYTKSGQTIVDGTVPFDFAFEQGKTVRTLSAASVAASPNVQCYSDGTDSSEYTIQVLSDGAAGSGAATFRASLDGGKTWLKDKNGNEAVFAANGENGKVRVGDLDVWFGTLSDPTAATDMHTGDTFTLVPKKALYWYTTAGTPENVTPQQYPDGTDNPRRITGGALGGAFLLRDVQLGEYQDSLDAMANSMVWEVNRLHSQGAGLTNFSSVQGSYSVSDTTVALASNASGLPYFDRLQSGALSMYVYDANGKLAKDAGGNPVKAAIAFDPATGSLDDLVTAINNAFSPTYLTATVVNKQLSITGAGTYTFQFGEDTTGVLAALGVNTLFTGSNASDVAINSTVASDVNRVCAGHVGTDGLAAAGDNTTATAIKALQDKAIDFSVTGQATTSQTLGGFYDALVGRVGADTSAASYQSTYQSSLADQTKAQKLAVSGVSLDEELTNLIKFQHSYQAAAKLISTANSMFETVLGMKN